MEQIFCLNTVKMLKKESRQYKMDWFGVTLGFGESRAKDVFVETKEMSLRSLFSWNRNKKRKIFEIAAVFLLARWNA